MPTIHEKQRQTPTSRLRSVASKLFHHDSSSKKSTPVTPTLQRTTPHTITRKASGFLNKLLTRSGSASKKSRHAHAPYYFEVISPAPSPAPSTRTSYLSDTSSPTQEILQTPAIHVEKPSMDLVRCRSANALLADMVDENITFAGSLASTASMESESMPDDLQSLIDGVTTSPASRVWTISGVSDTASFEGPVSTASAALRFIIQQDAPLSPPRPSFESDRSVDWAARSSLISERSEWSVYVPGERPGLSAERMMDDVDADVSLQALAAGISPSSGVTSSRTSLASSLVSLPARIEGAKGRSVSVISASSLTSAPSPCAIKTEQHRTSLSRYSFKPQDKALNRLSFESSFSSINGSPTPGMRSSKAPMLTATRLPRAGQQAVAKPSPRWARPLQLASKAGKVERPRLLSSMTGPLIPPDTPPPSSPSSQGERSSFDSAGRSSMDDVSVRSSLEAYRPSLEEANDVVEPLRTTGQPLRTARVPTRLRLSAFETIREEVAPPARSIELEESREGLFPLAPRAAFDFDPQKLERGHPVWREAVTTIAQSRSIYPDTDASFASLADFEAPCSVAAFLADSRARYHTLTRPISSMSTRSTPSLSLTSSRGHSSREEAQTPASPIARRRPLQPLTDAGNSNLSAKNKRQTVYIKADVPMISLKQEDHNRAQAISFATRRLEGTARPGDENDVLEAKGSNKAAAVLSRPRPATFSRSSRTKLASMR